MKDCQEKKPFKKPRITISALKGGSGKTILSLGLIAAWSDKGHRIAPFKKGPDFIDAGWLSFAAARSCYNLDPFMMNKEQILQSFVSHSRHADLSLIEGNRGVFDGLDPEGRCSTAELAKLLKTPVILIVDVTMATRTIAAVVKGCQAFDPELNVAGVILNRVAGSRQETLIRSTIETYCGIIVVGSVPKLRENVFPERHMGLVPYQERNQADKAMSWTKEIVMENLQLDAILRMASDAENIEAGFKYQPQEITTKVSNDVPKIGFIKDKAFWFYYPENLEQLERMGARLVEINAISQNVLPQLDALYIGGGFPEIQAQALADNYTFRNALREEIEKGLPVYAECGGFMYLGKNLVVDGRTYPMVGAIPIEFIIKQRPQGHGYTILEVKELNPYYPVGEILKGHEFHYSKPVLTGDENMDYVFKVCRGHGVDGERDGICMKNVLATFTHIHAAGNPRWAKGLFEAASEYRRGHSRENG
jgi:cobyrinic acid a,c-diamide synthase